ncbi:hypothetical protein [Acidipropionibacterium virtanenii]|uniref:Uncharacterized protein n=1 Tax=Acidipropionibacterium virtanenii TaxID=2057246 RepID=A0A344UVL3_9ACTN|nr:hypothetical protein [Acidipropionibacterium virtanenii]AXE39311.1 hypothetical protein JS278_02159 [Acidipropionibacterium virtanenii]
MSLDFASDWDRPDSDDVRVQGAIEAGYVNAEDLSLFITSADLTQIVAHVTGGSC